MKDTNKLRILIPLLILGLLISSSVSAVEAGYINTPVYAVGALIELYNGSPITSYQDILEYLNRTHTPLPTLNLTLPDWNFTIPDHFVPSLNLTLPDWDFTDTGGSGYQLSINNINPINKSVNVPVTKTIKVTFNENIKKGTNWIELKNSAGKAVTFTTSISGKILTIKPKSKLAESKYKLAIHTGAVTDLAGNPVALKTTSFTTGTPPTIKGKDPKNGATKVSRSKTIKVTFNEKIKAGSYYIELVSTTGKAVTIKKSIKDNVLTITHKDKLKPKTKYALRLHTGSVTDKVGNPLKAKTSYFTTGNT